MKVRSGFPFLAALGSIIFALFGVVSVLALATNPAALFTDNLTASGPSPGVTVMEQALLDRLDAAAISIDAALYDFNRISVRDALIDAHNRGVTVRVVTDDEAYENASYHPHFTALEAAGIPVIDDGRPGSIMHNKFFVIDGTWVWTGSTNLTDNGFTYNHNNSVVYTSTTLADIYRVEFEEMFVDGFFGTAKSDNTTHTLTIDGTLVEIYYAPTDDALQEVIAEVNAAADSIHFSIFFFTDDALRDALLARQMAGVTISGVWDKLGASNAFSDDETLCAAGIPIKIEDLGGKMHNKFMVIDAGGAAPRVVTGSMNWTNSGTSFNDENTLIIHDAAVAQVYQSAFQTIYDALDFETLCALGTNAVFLPVVSQGWSPGTAVTGNAVITEVFFDGAGGQEPDEYVAIRNDDTVLIQLLGWTLQDQAGKTFTFPSFVIQSGQECRVYTNEFHPESCGFDYGSGSPIWNNGGDCATLKDGSGAEINQFCY